ncbi:MAG: hypothetical protein ACJ746_21935 [Bryobacteraceae bacterium]
MSIATKRGDNGTTGIPGGVRVSKADRRVDCYGTMDELISQMAVLQPGTEGSGCTELRSLGCHCHFE